MRDVSQELVSRMIVGASWRERLLGLPLAMAKHPETFIAEMLESLRDVRGISIVPTCAALAVLARHDLFDPGRLSSGNFVRSFFDGEVGWAIDQAIQYAKTHSVSASARGPNYGQFFAHQVEVYEWIVNRQQDGPANGIPLSGTE